MAGWDDIINEISETKNPADMIRQKYLSELSELTGRNCVLFCVVIMSCWKFRY